MFMFEQLLDAALEVDDEPCIVLSLTIRPEFTVAEDDPLGKFKKGDRVTLKEVLGYRIPTVEPAPWDD
jgi:hypothetical protein